MGPRVYRSRKGRVAREGRKGKGVAPEFHATLRQGLAPISLIPSEFLHITQAWKPPCLPGTCLHR